MVVSLSSPVAESAQPGGRMPLDFGVDIPFVRLLGFELLQFEGGRSEIAFAPSAQHLNSFGVTHGGALMTLLDVSMATAARSANPELGVVTIEMKTSFMQPALASAASVPLLARGELLHRSATLAFSQSTVFDATGRACAHATGTFKYVRHLPTGAASSQALRVSTD